MRRLLHDHIIASKILCTVLCFSKRVFKSENVCFMITYQQFHNKARLKVSAISMANSNFKSCIYEDIGALCRQHRLKDAIIALNLIHHRNKRAYLETCVLVLRECAKKKALSEGRQVHILLVESQLELKLFMWNTLINMYVKCECLDDARQIFNKMYERNIFTWTTMIAGYTQNGNPSEALNLFQQMKQTGIEPNEVTFASVVNACSMTASLQCGKHIHVAILKTECKMDIFIGNSLINMYAKCSSRKDSFQTFDMLPVRDIVSWNVMVAGYTHHGNAKGILKFLKQMQVENIKPDRVSFLTSLSASATFADLVIGKQVHAYILCLGYKSDVFVGSALVDLYARCESIGDAWLVFKNLSSFSIVSWNTMIAGYARCGFLQHARQLFDSLPIKNVISWNAMICGYTQCDDSTEAIYLFRKMQLEGPKLEKVTYISVLNACTMVAAIGLGKCLHASTLKLGHDMDMVVGNALIDMYMKCGNMEEASQVFDRLPSRNVVSWSSMLAGFCEGKRAIKLFQEMHSKDVKIDTVGLTTVLSACSHACMVDEGIYYFGLIMQDTGIRPAMEHYACIIDLLSRTGYLVEAEDLIYSFPFPPRVEMWRSLLAACAIRGNLEVAKHAKMHIANLDPSDSASFVLVSNLYALATR